MVVALFGGIFAASRGFLHFRTQASALRTQRTHTLDIGLVFFLSFAICLAMERRSSRFAFLALLSLSFPSIFACIMSFFLNLVIGFSHLKYIQRRGKIGRGGGVS